MKRKKIIIVCNGMRPVKKLIKKANEDADLVICADGGANHLAALKIIPDIIIGDMDSITEKTKREFIKIKTIEIKDQDSTDLEKSLDYAIKKTPQLIQIFGAIGNRLDHSLSNLSILKKYHKYCDIEIITNNDILKLIDKNIEFNGKIGQTVSLIPFEKVENVITMGLKYPLRKEHLIFGVRESQSNMIVSNPVRITFTKGEFFLVLHNV